MTGTRKLALAAWLALGFPALAHCGHHGYGDCGDCDDCGHYCMRSQRGPARNSSAAGPRAAAPAASETREGKVVEVIYLPGATKDTAMVEVRLMAGGQPVLARLAPTGFLHQNQADIREGDTVTVTGYWVTSADGDMLVATRFTAKGKAVQLRDAWGQSAW